jgi:hypothetical protein
MPPELESTAAAAPAAPDEVAGSPPSAVEAAAKPSEPGPADSSSKPRAAVVKPAVRPPGRAHVLYEKAFEHRAAGEEDKALLAYRAALRTEGLSTSERADAETQVINLSRKYGEIEVMSPGVSGAVIAIDGRQIGRTPLRDPVLVRPGTHVVTMDLTGYQTRTARVTVAAGKKELLSLKLAR